MLHYTVFLYKGVFLLKKFNLYDYYYSDEIIASVVVNAVTKCDGIYCLEKKPMKLKYLFHNGENLKYVEMFQDDLSYSFILYLQIKNGYSIPKIADFVQNNVKMAVEKITEKKVVDVKVNIVSIYFED